MSEIVKSGKKQIIFAGGIFRDLVAYSERFPKVGETIFGSKFQMGFGGKSANQVRSSLQVIILFLLKQLKNQRFSNWGSRPF
jgi:hypothetical protein